MRNLHLRIGRLEKAVRSDNDLDQRDAFLRAEVDKYLAEFKETYGDRRDEAFASHIQDVGLQQALDEFLNSIMGQREVCRQKS